MSLHERRAHLIRAAIGLAERKGVSGVTTREVARSSGVSLGVVHYCFESKHALMAELVTVLSSAIRDCIETESGVGQPAGTGLGALRTMLREALSTFWLNVEAARQRQLLAYEAVAYLLRFDESPQVGSSIAREQYLTHDRSIREVLDHASRLAETSWKSSPETLSRMVVTVLDGAILRWLVDDDATAARQQLDLLADTLVAHAVAVGHSLPPQRCAESNPR